jgi:hypothetical protein
VLARESFEAKRRRLREESPFGGLRGWDVESVIVKSHDDLFQEMFAMQLIDMFNSVFKREGADATLTPYRIVATATDGGLIQTVVDAHSVDSIKAGGGRAASDPKIEISRLCVPSRLLREALWGRGVRIVFSRAAQLRDVAGGVLCNLVFNADTRQVRLSLFFWPL